jgi:amidophosphoribosyltransferase
MAARRKRSARKSVLTGCCSRIWKGSADIDGFDDSVFTGNYITGDIDKNYLDVLQSARSDAAKDERRKNDDEVIDLYNSA